MYTHSVSSTKNKHPHQWWPCDLPLKLKSTVESVKDHEINDHLDKSFSTEVEELMCPPCAGTMQRMKSKHKVGANDIVIILSKDHTIQTVIQTKWRH